MKLNQSNRVKSQSCSMRFCFVFNHYSTGRRHDREDDLFLTCKSLDKAGKYLSKVTEGLILLSSPM